VPQAAAGWSETSWAGAGDLMFNRQRAWVCDTGPVTPRCYDLFSQRLGRSPRKVQEAIRRCIFL
jgi:hypothetical protein